MSKTKTPRKTKPKYEPVLRLPPLPEDQYLGLRDSIAVTASWFRSLWTAVAHAASGSPTSPAPVRIFYSTV